MQDQPNPSQNPKQDIYDLTGEVFGFITVVKLDHIDPKQGRRFWLIRCHCGTESVRPANAFIKKVPPCNGCRDKALRESGLATPDDIMALGFDITFFQRFFPRINKNGPIPSHMPYLGQCHLWTGAMTSRGRGSIQTGTGKIMSTHVAAFIIATGQLVPNNLFVCHHCDTPLCVRFEHLFTDTNQGNMDDMNSKGRSRHASGEKHGNAVLTNEQVKEIRRLRQSVGCTYKELSEAFKCSPSTIAWIIQGHYWRNV